MITGRTRPGSPTIRLRLRERTQPLIVCRSSDRIWARAIASMMSPYGTGSLFYTHAAAFRYRDCPRPGGNGLFALTVKVIAFILSDCIEADWDRAHNRFLR